MQEQFLAVSDPGRKCQTEKEAEVHTTIPNSQALCENVEPARNQPINDVRDQPGSHSDGNDWSCFAIKRQPKQYWANQKSKQDKSSREPEDRHRASLACQIGQVKTLFDRQGKLHYNFSYG